VDDADELADSDAVEVGEDEVVAEADVVPDSDGVALKDDDADADQEFVVDADTDADVDSVAVTDDVGEDERNAQKNRTNEINNITTETQGPIHSESNT